MPSPFPGMDPYLEQSIFWSEFHSRLIVALADAIAPSLLPKYYVGVETRTYLDSSDEELLIGIPDAVVLSSAVDLITDYRIVVSQCDRRPKADLYAFTLREAIPEFLLPLKEPQEFTTVNLQSVVSGVYERGGYAFRIDYRQAVPPPPISGLDSQWVEELLTLWHQN